MNRRTTILTMLALAAVALIWAAQASAYSRYSGSNNCNQCHPAFEGGPGAQLHNFHTSFADCSECHVSIGDNPRTSACAACHIPDPLWNFHRVNAPSDGNGFTCSTCHEFVGNDVMSWSATKQAFR
ncbi:hypothetical protein KKG45_04860 [bacterium]|nr:hypothetical protein [bacterium]MBU1072558.1 hypothetical protein [bacterium]MBU1675732.1 hypothetical protein [bacterium]